MEGNRHEKIAIVICGYIIGFTTAFIGFGVNNLNQEVVSEVAYVPVQRIEKVQEVTDEAVITSVSFGDDGLYASTPSKSFLLSLKKVSTGASVIGAIEIPGYHSSVIDAEVSRDGKFAYFCEQLSEENKTCDGYVYSIDDDMLHKITLDGSTYLPTIDQHVSSWSEDGLLTVSGNNSLDSTKPWSLGVMETNSPEDEQGVMDSATTPAEFNGEAQVQ